LWCQLCIQTKKRNAIILRSVWNSWMDSNSIVAV
jgi:hypothetical protein